MTKLTDFTGQTLGRWTVLKRAPNSASGQTRWHCRCSCGTERIVFSTSLALGSSCGCAKRERTIERSTKHGHATNGISPTYHSWAGMMARCSNPKHRSFKEYGGRGIKVCKRWHKFANFLADMGEKPDGLSLDRHPNQDGDYKKTNCRWATGSQQARNKSNNFLITVGSVCRAISDWGDIYGVNPGTIRDRLANGWESERAVSTPALSKWSRVPKRLRNS